MTAVAASPHTNLLLVDHHQQNDSNSAINDATMPNVRRVPFPLPKKLGSDRLLLVSKALHEIPTFKSISPELQNQRKALKRPSFPPMTVTKRVCFRAVDQIHEYETDYSSCNHEDLWFSDAEFASIFERDDHDFTVCYSSMAHTKQILQLWGMCSRGLDDSDSDNDDGAALPEPMITAVEALFREVPHPHARGLEQRIITGIRNHRQKAVQSFLQHHRQQKQQEQGAASNKDPALSLCPRYLKFSQTAGRFARALAEGDARVAQTLQAQDEEGSL